MRKFRKLLSVILAVMMVMSVMPVGATTNATGGAGATWPVIPEGATLIFAEDFESDYTADTNLLEADGEAEFTKDGKKVMTLKQPAGDAVPEGYSAKVMAVDGFEGNALCLENSVYNSNSNEVASNLAMTIYINGGEKVDFTSETVNDEPNPYYGKQLVFEFDAKFANLKERQVMKIDAGVNSSKSGVITPFQKATGSNWSLRNGPWETVDGVARPWYLTTGMSAANKTTFKVVFDQTGAVDVNRTYKNGAIQKIDKSAAAVSGAGQSWNGKIIKDFVGEYYRGEAEVNMGASTNFLSYVTPNSSGKTASVILDNIVVYAVDPINFVGFEAVANVNPDEGLKVKFDQPFNATTDTFKVTDMAGTEISNAITAVEMADAQTAVVKMDFGTLSPVTSYKLFVDDEFTSAAGALFYTNPLGITAADEWIELGSFETCAKLDVEISPASGAILDYDKGETQEITLTFSSPLSADVDFANAFTVEDETNAVIDGLVATLNDERTVGVLNLSGLALGEGVHTIKSKQNAIYNDSNIKASITYVFDTVDFKAITTPVKIDQYIAGSSNDNIIEVALTAATTLTNDNIITGFEVTDQAGNVINGLGAMLDDSATIVTLDLIDMDLAPGKYNIKSTEYLKDKRERNLETTMNIPFKVVTEISDATLIIEEDFEVDYPVGTNWLEGTGSNLEVDAADGGKWTISGANGADNYMGVVDGTTLVDKTGNSLGFDSKVLKITAGTATALQWWRKPAAGSVDVAAQDKVLIYEFDVWADGNAAEKKFMAIDTSTANGFQRLSGSSWPASTGVYWDSSRDAEASKWYARSTFGFDKKSKMVVIVDQTADVDSMRYYHNGNVIKAKYSAVDPAFANYGKTAYDFYGENYAGKATLDYGPFEGIYTDLKGKSLATTIYIDNLKAYTVNTIEFDGIDWGANDPAVFNPDTGLTINFTERVRANDLRENMILTDTNGNVISGAIKAITLSDDEKSAKVKFDFNKLEKFTEYNLTLNFLFRSKEGAYIARDGIIDGGDVLLANFTTSDKLEVEIAPATVSGYDKGVEKEVVATLSSPLKADITDIAGLFEVKDEAGNEIAGLEATISEDRKVITLQLAGLQLGDGIHTIATKEGVLVNDANVAGSIMVTVHTISFAGIGSPVDGGIVNFVEGTNQDVVVTLTIPTTIADEDLNNAFVVTDENGTAISGLAITKSEDNKTFTLNLKDLVLGLGEHTIKSTDLVKDSRGRALGFTYNFTILPFYAEYSATVEGYVPGTEATAEIRVTYPLNASSIAGVDKAFVVKNKYGSNVAGLVASVLEDNKTIVLDFAGLDIEGGEYQIISKPGVFVNNKGEVLNDISITLSTSAIVEDVVAEDTGVTPNAGAEMTGDFVTTVLLEETFDDEGYNRNVNWLSSPAFVPGNFDLVISGDGDKFVDANVSIVEDPVKPGNYVLKNVAGYRDMNGNVIASTSNYHKIKRNLDTGVSETIPVDDSTVVKLSTRVYIPEGGASGMPTSDSGVMGNTKDVARIIALTNSGTTPLNHSNLRRSGGTAQYNSWINASDSASGSSGSVTKSLTSGEWHTIELIFGNNVKTNGTKFKSYEVWIDGTKITSVGGSYIADYTTVGGMMSMLATATGGSGTTTVLYDDWKIVRGAKLATHINVPKAEVAEEQVVKLQLTNRLSDESVALIEANNLITVKDNEGNDVKATIAIDNTGINTKVVITPEYGFKYQTDYKVEIAENYVNDKGITTNIVADDGSVFGGFEYNFATAKAAGNTIDVDNGTLSYTEEFMEDETTFNYTMNLKEAVGTTEVIGAVATFSETNELLGIDYKIFNTGDTSKAFTVSSDLGTKYVRLFIWEKNADGTMGKLMQIPDEVTSR